MISQGPGDYCEKIPDVSVYGESGGTSTVFLFTPRSRAAAEWIAENVQGSAVWFGNSLAVDHRHAADLVRVMQEDGLVLK